MTDQDLESIFRPLLSGDVARWQGLPMVGAGELIDWLGEPLERETVELGAYPAERLRFAEREGRALTAFERYGSVVMVEVLPPPDSRVLAELPEPDAILPQEIALEGAYAHEYLYASRGLLLTVAEYFDTTRPKTIVRCRGIRPVADASEVGPELYVPLDARTKW